MTHDPVPGSGDRLIVVPTYNEKDNILALLEAIDRETPGLFDILFVDDNSPDGTGQEIEAIARKRSNIYVLHRKEKNGLGSAYLAGFRWGLERKYRYFFEMDADLSHDPRYLLPMLETLNNVDFVLGTRFMGDLKNINTSFLRILNSVAASAYMRFVLGLRCSDPMGGYVGYRRRVLESLDYSGFIARGYLFQAEIKYGARIRGFSFAEIPIIFKNRGVGASKMSRKDVLEALILPWKIRFNKKRP